MSKSISQAQEYAAKKKALMERAAKIKEDRKRGIVDGEEEEDYNDPPPPTNPTRRPSQSNISQPQQQTNYNSFTNNIQQPPPPAAARIRADAEYSSAKYSNNNYSGQQQFTQQQQQQPVYSNSPNLQQYSPSVTSSPSRKGPLIKKAPWESRDGNPSLSLLKAKHGAKLAAQPPSNSYPTSTPLAPAPAPTPAPTYNSNNYTSNNAKSATRAPQPTSQSKPPPQQQKQQPPPPQFHPPPPSHQTRPQYEEENEDDEEGDNYTTQQNRHPAGTQQGRQAYSQYPQFNGEGEDESGDMEGGQFDDSDLVPCPDCGRRFKEDRLAKHQKACKKVFKQKRKQFNSTAARVEGTEAAKFVSKQLKQPQQTQGQGEPKIQVKKNARWKYEHEQFMNAIRAARGAPPIESGGGSGGSGGGAPPAPYIDPNSVQCPHCERRFNATAGERHIPFCKNQRSKPSRLQKGGGLTVSNARSKNATPEKSSPIISTHNAKPTPGGLKPTGGLGSNSGLKNATAKVNSKR